MHDRVKFRARRQIPAVSRVLDSLGNFDLPRPIIVDLIRRKLSQIRAEREVPEFESIVAVVRRSLDELRASRLQPIINGTGVVIHTNFGRAPLAGEAVRALNEIGSGYSNLEYDLAAGERGRRGEYIEKALAMLCGAESASSGEISALARKKRVPFVEDLGSGAVVATEELGIADHESTPSEALKAGADLVCFSGDKLFGGPQAGIIIGKRRFVAGLKRE